MVVAMALWCYRLVRPHAGIGPALVAGVTIGMMPSMLAMSQAVMTEIPTAFLMLGTIIEQATVARDDPRLRWPLLIGILAGLAVLIRVVPLVALLPAVGLLLLLPWRKRQARLALRSGLVTMAVVCLPLGWFLVRSGTVRLANSTGLHLYNRVVFTQHLLDGTGGATRALVKRLEGADPRTMAFWDVRKFPGIESLGYAGAERLLGAVAMEGIRNAPVAFLAYSPQVGWDEIRRTPFWDIPRWTDTQTEGAATLESHRPLRPPPRGTRPACGSRTFRPRAGQSSWGSPGSGWCSDSDPGTGVECSHSGGSSDHTCWRAHHSTSCSTGTPST